MHLRSPLKPGTKKKQLSELALATKKQVKEETVTERAKRLREKKRLANLQAQPPVVTITKTEAPWKRRNTEVPSKETFSADPNLQSNPHRIPDEARLKYAKQLAILSPKGAYQLITSPDLVRDLGRKTQQLSDDSAK